MTNRKLRPSSYAEKAENYAEKAENKVSARLEKMIKMHLHFQRFFLL